MLSRVTRRRFIERASGAAIPLFVGAGLNPWTGGVQRGADPARELSADLVIIGGGFGGCAAALAAARSGLRVIMTEETDWIGGQLTAQAVPLDENAWIESSGGTASYRLLRQRIRDEQSGAFQRENLLALQDADVPQPGLRRRRAHAGPRHP